MCNKPSHCEPENAEMRFYVVQNLRAVRKFDSFESNKQYSADVKAKNLEQDVNESDALSHSDSESLD